MQYHRTPSDTIIIQHAIHGATSIYDGVFSISTSLKYFCPLEVSKAESALTFAGRHMKHSLRIHLDPAKKGNLSLGFLIRWHEKEIVQLDEKPFFHLFSSSTILVGPVGGQWEGHSVQRTHMYIYIYIWVLWTYMWCLWIYHHIFFGIFMYVCNKSVWPSCMRNSLDLKLSLIKWFFG